MQLISGFITSERKPPLTAQVCDPVHRSGRPVLHPELPPLDGLRNQRVAGAHFANRLRQGPDEQLPGQSSRAGTLREHQRHRAEPRDGEHQDQGAQERRWPENSDVIHPTSKGIYTVVMSKPVHLNEPNHLNQLTKMMQPHLFHHQPTTHPLSLQCDIDALNIFEAVC